MEVNTYLKYYKYQIIIIIIALQIHLFNSKVYCQIANIIPSDRVVDWTTAGCKNRNFIYDKVFNVKESPYNAVGDGVADDNSALENVITDAKNFIKTNPDKHAIIFFPAGTYRCCYPSKNFRLNSNILIKMAVWMVLKEDKLLK